MSSKPLDHCSVFDLGIIGKSSTHVGGIGDVASCGFLREVELSNYFPIVEVPIK